MFTEKKVSVVIATYNGGLYIKEQINSILLQTSLPDEIIVCDDCSSDDTIEIISQFSKTELIKYYRNEKQLGVIANFKKGVSLCKQGNYISLCDQDDVWTNNKLQKSVEVLSSIDNNITPCVVFSDLVLVDDRLNVICHSYIKDILKLQPDKVSIKRVLFDHVITGCTIMMNSAMRLLFCDMPLNIFMHDTWVGYIAYTFGKFEYINEPLVYFRRHGKNVTVASNSYSNMEKINILIKNIFYDKEIGLDKSINTAIVFYNKYEDRLLQEEKKIFQTFIKLKKSSVLKKRVLSYLIRNK